MLTSVLYQNSSATTTLLDLPASIQNGQCLRYDKPVRDVNHTLSTRPAEEPYPSTEPKGVKRAKLLEKIPPTEQAYHLKIQALVSGSVQEIRSAVGECRWLLPRQHLASEPLQMSPELKASETLSEPSVILSPISNVFPSLEELGGRIFSNPFNLRTKLVVDRYAYQIPPQSTFLLSDVKRSRSLVSSTVGNVLPRSFDLIVMDPPWQNRSVKHAKTYKTTNYQSEDPFQSVLPIVHSHLSSDGLVGVWVTNKASIRQAVLSALQGKGFQLYEEWVWIKVTTSGEPVTSLDGLWRRPYEVFLLFRRGASPRYGTPGAAEHASVFHGAPLVQRRVFVAVPDYHSRKPCLKEFIEPMLVDSTKYRALEIFARDLTAGWFCWGDEVLKFAEEVYWAGNTG